MKKIIESKSIYTGMNALVNTIQTLVKVVNEQTEQIDRLFKNQQDLDQKMDSKK